MSFAVLWQQAVAPRVGRIIIETSVDTMTTTREGAYSSGRVGSGNAGKRVPRFSQLSGSERAVRLALVVCAVAACLVGHVRAQVDRSWVSPDGGSFGTGTNWDLSGASDRAFIELDGTYTVNYEDGDAPSEEVYIGGSPQVGDEQTLSIDVGFFFGDLLRIRDGGVVLVRANTTAILAELIIENGGRLEVSGGSVNSAISDTRITVHEGGSLLFLDADATADDSAYQIFAEMFIVNGLMAVNGVTEISVLLAAQTLTIDGANAVFMLDNENAATTVAIGGSVVGATQVVALENGASIVCECCATSFAGGAASTTSATVMVDGSQATCGGEGNLFPPSSEIGNADSGSMSFPVDLIELAARSPDMGFAASLKASAFLASSTIDLTIGEDALMAVTVDANSTVALNATDVAVTGVGLSVLAVYGSVHVESSCAVGAPECAEPLALTFDNVHLFMGDNASIVVDNPASEMVGLEVAGGDLVLAQQANLAGFATVTTDGAVFLQQSAQVSDIAAWSHAPDSSGNSGRFFQMASSGVSMTGVNLELGEGTMDITLRPPQWNDGEVILDCTAATSDIVNVTVVGTVRPIIVLGSAGMGGDAFAWCLQVDAPDAIIMINADSAAEPSPLVHLGSVTTTTELVVGTSISLSLVFGDSVLVTSAVRSTGGLGSLLAAHERASVQVYSSIFSFSTIGAVNGGDFVLATRGLASLEAIQTSVTAASASLTGVYPLPNVDDWLEVVARTDSGSPEDGTVVGSAYEIYSEALPVVTVDSITVGRIGEAALSRVIVVNAFQGSFPLLEVGGHGELYTGGPVSDDVRLSAMVSEQLPSTHDDTFAFTFLSGITDTVTLSSMSVEGVAVTLLTRHGDGGSLNVLMTGTTTIGPLGTLAVSGSSEHIGEFDCTIAGASPIMVTNPLSNQVPDGVEDFGGFVSCAVDLTGSVTVSDNAGLRFSGSVSRVNIGLPVDMRSGGALQFADSVMLSGPPDIVEMDRGSSLPRISFVDLATADLSGAAGTTLNLANASLTINAAMVAQLNDNDVGLDVDGLTVVGTDPSVALQLLSDITLGLGGLTIRGATFALTSASTVVLPTGGDAIVSIENGARVTVETDLNDGHVVVVDGGVVTFVEANQSLATMDLGENTTGVISDGVTVACTSQFTLQSASLTIEEGGVVLIEEDAEPSIDAGMGLNTTIIVAGNLTYAGGLALEVFTGDVVDNSGVTSDLVGAEAPNLGRLSVTVTGTGTLGVTGLAIVAPLFVTLSSEVALPPSFDVSIGGGAQVAFNVDEVSALGRLAVGDGSFALARLEGAGRRNVDASALNLSVAGPISVINAVLSLEGVRVAWTGTASAVCSLTGADVLLADAALEVMSGVSCTSSALNVADVNSTVGSHFALFTGSSLTISDFVTVSSGARLLAMDDDVLQFTNSEAALMVSGTGSLMSWNVASIPDMALRSATLLANGARPAVSVTNGGTFHMEPAASATTLSNGCDAVFIAASVVTDSTSFVSVDGQVCVGTGSVTLAMGGDFGQLLTLSGGFAAGSEGSIVLAGENAQGTVCNFTGGASGGLGAIESSRWNVCGEGSCSAVTYTATVNSLLLNDGMLAFTDVCSGIDVTGGMTMAGGVSIQVAAHVAGTPSGQWALRTQAAVVDVSAVDVFVGCGAAMEFAGNVTIPEGGVDVESDVVLDVCGAVAVSGSISLSGSRTMMWTDSPNPSAPSEGGSFNVTGAIDLGPEATLIVDIGPDATYSVVGGDVTIGTNATLAISRPLSVVSGSVELTNATSAITNVVEGDGALTVSAGGRITAAGGTVSVPVVVTGSSLEATSTVTFESGLDLQADVTLRIGVGGLEANASIDTDGFGKVNVVEDNLNITGVSLVVDAMNGFSFASVRDGDRIPVLGIVDTNGVLVPDGEGAGFDLVGTLVSVLLDVFTSAEVSDNQLFVVLDSDSAARCPADGDGRQCAGVGTCNLASAVCTCPAGTTGNDCGDDESNSVPIWAVFLAVLLVMAGVGVIFAIFRWSGDDNPKKKYGEPAGQDNQDGHADEEMVEVADEQHDNVEVPPVGMQKPDVEVVTGARCFGLFKSKQKPAAPETTEAVANVIGLGGQWNQNAVRPPMGAGQNQQGFTQGYGGPPRPITAPMVPHDILISSGAGAGTGTGTGTAVGQVPPRPVTAAAAGAQGHMYFMTGYGEAPTKPPNSASHVSPHMYQIVDWVQAGTLGAVPAAPTMRYEPVEDGHGGRVLSPVNGHPSAGMEAVFAQAPAVPNGARPVSAGSVTSEVQSVGALALTLASWAGSGEAGNRNDGGSVGMGGAFMQHNPIPQFPQSQR